MLSRTGLGAVILAVGLMALPVDDVMAAKGGAGAPHIEGVWTCTVLRAGTIERPILLTFSGDGTFNYSSATTINSLSAGPVQNSGFHSRGGGRGEWTRVSNKVVRYKAVELLYDANGNAAGSFAVDSTQLLTPNDQLCSGRDECPSQKTTFSLAKYVFEQNDPDADIVGVTFLLPPGTPANFLCNRFSSGAGFPGMPIPMP